MPDATSRRIRALAIDVDGTLLTPDHEVTPAARRAIRVLRDADVLPVITTSRHPAGIVELLRKLGLIDQPAVTCQGAVWGACDQGGNFHARSVRYISGASARDVTQMARARGCGVSWFYADGWLAETDDPMVEQEELVTGASAQRVVSLGDSCPPPNKILIMAPPGRMGDLAEVHANLPVGLSGATSRADYLEVVPLGVSKWSALLQVYESQQVPLGQTAAIGDGNNDLEMIVQSAVGIAMGHAPAPLLAAADWVAPDNSHEGFSAAVGWLLHRRPGTR